MEKSKPDIHETFANELFIHEKASNLELKILSNLAELDPQQTKILRNSIEKILSFSNQNSDEKMLAKMIRPKLIKFCEVSKIKKPQHLTNEEEATAEEKWSAALREDGLLEAA